MQGDSDWSKTLKLSTKAVFTTSQRLVMRFTDLNQSHNETRNCSYKNYIYLFFDKDLISIEEN